MRRLINSTFVGIDGVINHMEAWHFAYVDDETGQIATEQLLASDALLMGRKTYEITTSDMLFSEGNTGLKLLDTRTLNSGVVILSYRPVHAEYPEVSQS